MSQIELGELVIFNRSALMDSVCASIEDALVDSARHQCFPLFDRLHAILCIGYSGRVHTLQGALYLSVLERLIWPNSN